MFGEQIAFAPGGEVYLSFTAITMTTERFDSVAIPTTTLVPGAPVTLGGPFNPNDVFLSGFGAAAIQAGGVAVPFTGFNTDQSLPTVSTTVSIMYSKDGGQTWTPSTPAGTFSNQAFGAVLIGPVPGVYPDDAVAVFQDGSQPNITTTFNEFSNHP